MVSPIANNNNKAHVSALYSRVHAAASVSCSKSTALYTDSSRAGSKMHNVSRTSVFVTLYGIYYLAKNPPKSAINQNLYFNFENFSFGIAYVIVESNWSPNLDR